MKCYHRRSQRSVETAVLFVMLLLPSCRRAESLDIERIQAFHFRVFPNASIGEMINRVFPDARWTETRGAHDEVVITAKGSIAAELEIMLNSDASTITGVSFTINGVRQSTLTTRQFLNTVYRLAYPPMQQLVGRWVNKEGIERVLYFRTNGTFHMHSWPWDCGGRYELDSDRGSIVLRPEPPLDPAVPKLEFAYTVINEDHIVFTDPNSDVFLASTPLQFERQ